MRNTKMKVFCRIITSAKKKKVVRIITSKLNNSMALFAFKNVTFLLYPLTHFSIFLVNTHFSIFLHIAADSPQLS